MDDNNFLEKIIKTKKYVYGDIEVNLTGRIATKNSKSGKELKLVEITSIDPDVNWKKWVFISDLFEIQN